MAEPFTFNGPFVGLATTHGPREIGPGFATKAHNVVVYDGVIRPRRPWQNMLTAQQMQTLGSHRIRSMFHWRRAGSQQHPYLLLKTDDGISAFAGKLWNLTGGQLMELASGLAPGPANFVLAGDICYVVDGSERMYMTRGGPSTTTRVGIAAPRDWSQGGLIAFFGPIGGGAPGVTLPSNASYAVTYYEPETGRESNPVYSNNYSIPAYASFRITYNAGGVAPADAESFDKVRIYRRNNTLGQPFYRLVAELAFVHSVNQTWDDVITEDAITLSNTTLGPFAPSRNGLPPRSYHAAWYKDRMFYAPADEPGLLYYSELGAPQHVAGDGYVSLVGDESDTITGLIEVTNTLFIGKAGAIWGLSGAITAPDNRTAALGLTASLPVSGHDLFKTRAGIGPMPGSGPGFILAGDPPRIFFATEAGFQSFDGDGVSNRAMGILPTWDGFLRRGTGAHDDVAITYAMDPVQKIIYMCNARNSTVQWPGPAVLAFHYGTGGWTTQGLSPLVEPPSDAPERVWCVATSLGDLAFDDAWPQTIQSALAVGTEDGRVLMSVTDGAAETDVAAWAWHTGHMSLGTHVQKNFQVFYVLLCRPLELLEDGTFNSRPWVGDTPMCKVYYSANGAMNLVGGWPKLLQLVGKGQRRSKVPYGIGRHADDLQVRFEVAPQWAKGYCRDAGITGFVLDYELSGDGLTGGW